jgi:SNF2 family DNA or RNA helicase
MSYINANDIDSLKEKLGFAVESQSSISEMLTINFKRNLGNEIKHYEYINSLEIQEDDKTDRLEKIQKKIDEIKTSIGNVEERVKITADSMCPICRDTLTQPIGNTSCCKNMFCFECITSYFTSSGGKSGECPCCRAKIGLKGVTIVSSNDAMIQKSNARKYITKEDMFIDLLCQTNMPLAKKWLVFSSFDATFQGIINQLDSRGVRYSKLYGTVQHIQRVINDFRDGTIQVLLLNAVHFGMGLNLEMATDILIYHKMSIETERQVIGRAQRPGRSSPLNVHYLCHTNELTEYKLRYPESLLLNCVEQSSVL